MPPLFTRLKMSTTTSSVLSVPGDLLDVEVDVGDAEQAAEPADIVTDLRRMVGVCTQASDEFAESGRALLHQLGHVDPERIVLHLHRLVEGEGLGIQVEPQPGEGLGVAVEELGRLAAHDAVERGHALLAVEQQLDDARRERARRRDGPPSSTRSPRRAGRRPGCRR